MRDNVPQGAITELHEWGPQPAPHLPPPVFSFVGSLSCSDRTENRRTHAPQSPHPSSSVNLGSVSPRGWSLGARTGSGDGGEPAQGRHGNGCEGHTLNGCHVQGRAAERSAVTPTVHPRSLRGGFSPVGHKGSKEVPESSLVPRARKKPCWLRTFKPLGQPQLEAQLRHGVTDLCFLKSP